MIVSKKPWAGYGVKSRNTPLSTIKLGTFWLSTTDQVFAIRTFSLKMRHLEVGWRGG